MVGRLTVARPRRHLAATIVALIVAGAYVIVCLHYLGELDHKGQAALVGVSVFGLVTSAVLLYDVAQSTNKELGNLSHERASLNIALIMVCIYVPLSIGGTFIDAVKSQPPGAAPTAAPPAEIANTG